MMSTLSTDSLLTLLERRGPTAALALLRRGPTAALALLTHRTVREAAAAASISPATLVRWCKVPAFRRMVDETRRTLQHQRTVEMAKLEAERLQPA